MSFIVGRETLPDGSELTVERTGMPGIIGLWRLINYRGMTCMGTITQSRKNGSIYANLPMAYINHQYIRCITFGDEADERLKEKIEKIWAAAPSLPSPQHAAIMGNSPDDPTEFVQAF